MHLNGKSVFCAFAKKRKLERHISAAQFASKQHPYVPKSPDEGSSDWVEVVEVVGAPVTTVVVQFSVDWIFTRTLYRVTMLL